MKKICLIYANCQNLLLATFLAKSKTFTQEYEIKRLPVHVLMAKGATIPDNLVKRTKLFIYQPVKDIYGERSSRHIISKLSSDCLCISFPPLYFTGYFPQYIKNPANKIIKPNFPHGVIPHGDSNIISLWKQGKNTTEIIEILKNPDFYTEKFVLDNLNQSLAELSRRESFLTIKISEFIKSHYQDYYLFYTHNHPSDILGIYVVNQILEELNLPAIANPLSVSNPERGVLDNFQIPIYPSVTKNLKLKFVNYKKNYKHGSFCTLDMTFDRYISEYIQIHNLDRENASQHFFQGLEFAQKEYWDEAKISLEAAISIDSNNAAYYGELGNILSKNNNLSEAIIAYKKAIELSPRWEEFYKSLGDILFKNNNFSEAILVYEKAVELNPDKAYYYRCLGNIFEKQKNLSLAIKKYRKAVQLAPKKAKFYHNLASALARDKKIDEAITICKEAININPKNANFYRTLENIHMQKKAVDDSLDVYQQAI